MRVLDGDQFLVRIFLGEAEGCAWPSVLLSAFALQTTWRRSGARRHPSVLTAQDRAEECRGAARNGQRRSGTEGGAYA